MLYIKVENVIKVENATQDRKCHQGRLLRQCASLSAKKNKKGQNTEVMKLNSRQLIHNLKTEIVALK